MARCMHPPTLIVFLFSLSSDFLVLIVVLMQVVEVPAETKPKPKPKFTMAPAAEPATRKKSKTEGRRGTGYPGATTAVVPGTPAKVLPKDGMTKKATSAEHKRITGAIQDAMGHDAKFKGKKKCPADRLQYVIKKALMPSSLSRRRPVRLTTTFASAWVRPNPPRINTLQTGCMSA